MKKAEELEQKLKEMRQSFLKQIKELNAKYEELERKYCNLKDSNTSYHQ
jgi:hypothetical protein